MSIFWILELSSTRYMIEFVILSDIVITSKAVSQVSGEIPNIDIHTKWLTITYNMYQSFAGLQRKHSSLYWILAELDSHILPIGLNLAEPILASRS